MGVTRIENVCMESNVVVCDRLSMIFVELVESSNDEEKRLGKIVALIHIDSTGIVALL